MVGIFALANRIGTSFAPILTVLHAWTIVETHGAGVVAINNTICVGATCVDTCGQGSKTSIGACVRDVWLALTFWQPVIK